MDWGLSSSSVSSMGEGLEEARIQTLVLQITAFQRDLSPRQAEWSEAQITWVRGKCIHLLSFSRHLLSWAPKIRQTKVCLLIWLRTHFSEALPKNGSAQETNLYGSAEGSGRVIPLHSYGWSNWVLP